MEATDAFGPGSCLLELLKSEIRIRRLHLSVKLVFFPGTPK